MSISVFDLFATLKLDSSEYDKGLNEAESKGTSIGSKIGSGLVKTAKAAGVAIGAAATAVGALATASVKNFADYEQLVGGVQKLYGNAGQSLKEYAKATGQTVEQAKGDYKKLEKAQNMVLDNASQAYKTAGMDMNTYMENATSFSAALINSLGGDTVQAAKQTDVAMRAISDNVNTFGSDMDSVTNAFMGFSKQNYTMLDNLKLGYGGTKEEMQRLIDDANAWGKANGEASNLSINSFSDVVTAIEQIQKAQGIAGTTQREAASTISGSIEMTKAAWSNLLTAFSDPEQDIGAKIDQLVESAGAAFGNLVPVIEQSLQGIGQFVEKIAPMISEKLPVVVQTVLPSLLSAATSLVSGLVTALPSIILVIVQQIPMLIDGIVTAITATAPAFLDAGKQLFKMLGDGIKSAASFAEKNGSNVIDKVLNTITKNLPKFLDNGVKLITNLANGLLNALPTVISKAGDIMSKLISFIVKNAPTMLEKGVDLIVNLANGLVKALPNIVASAMEVTAKLIQQILKALPQLIEAGFKLIGKLAAGIIKAIPDAINAVTSVRDKAIETLKSFNWLSIGVNIINGIVSGIKSMGSAVITAILGIAKSSFDAIKNFFGIKSPSKKMRDEIGRRIVDGMIQGINDKKENAKKSAEELSALYVKSAKSKLKDLKSNNKISIIEEVDYWRAVLSHCKKGTKAYEEAHAEIGKAKQNVQKQSDKIFASYNKSIEAMTKSYDKSTNKLSSDLKKQQKEIQKNLNETIKALEKTYSETVKNRRNEIMGQMGLFSEVKLDDAISKTDLTNNLRNQVRTLEQWDSTLFDLEERIGGESGLVDELRSMGVSSLGTLQQLNQMSDEELFKYVSLYERKAKLAQNRAEKENETLKADVDQQIEDAKQAAEKKFDKLQEKYDKNMEKLTTKFNKDAEKLSKTMRSQYKSIGVNMGEGLEVGLSTQMKKTRKKMVDDAKSLVKAVKKELKISSPSKVFSEIGEFIAEGLDQGFTKEIPHAQNNITNRVKDLITATNNTIDMIDAIDSNITAKDRTNNERGNMSIVMNIYGAQNQDVNQLAEIISNKLGEEVRRAGVVWA